jgi:hypothetical protein
MATHLTDVGLYGLLNRTHCIENKELVLLIKEPESAKFKIVFQDINAKYYSEGMDFIYPADNYELGDLIRLMFDVYPAVKKTHRLFLEDHKTHIIAMMDTDFEISLSSDRIIELGLMDDVYSSLKVLRSVDERYIFRDIRNRDSNRFMKS